MGSVRFQTVATPQVPLLKEQIDAAQAIYIKYTASWRRTDDALIALDEAMPGFGHPAALIKVAALDKLYGTYVPYVDSVALRVEAVLDGVDRADLASAGPQLVEDLAAVTVPSGGIIRYRSFASKFAHFFIDHHRFPIHDSFAADALRAHLGRHAPAPEDDKATYMDRAEAFWELADSAGESDTRRMDRYLWIVGQYRKWAENSAAKINWEPRRVFEEDPPELAVAAGTWYHPRD